MTTITSQDNFYPSELLVQNGSEVGCIKLCKFSFNTQHINHIFQHLHNKNSSAFVHYGGLRNKPI